MKKKIAHNVMEYGLLLAAMAVIAVAFWGIVNSKSSITKLTNLSKVTVNK